MSENIEVVESSGDPISPSEAARALSQYRWNRDQNPGQSLAAFDAKQTPTESPPSDELFGGPGVEAGQGYTQMSPAFPVKVAEGDALESTDVIKRPAADDGQPLETVREYQKMSGKDAGAPLPANQTVSAEQAAADVALARQGEAETQAALEDLELQHAIDQLRAGDQQQQPEQVQAQPTRPEAQVVDQVQRVLESNPAVLEALRSQVAATEQQAAQTVGAYQQQYIAGLANHAQVAAAALFHDLPELSSGADIDSTLRVIAAQNPERYRALAQRVGQVQSLMQDYQRAEQQTRQAYAAQAQQQLEATNKAADDQYEKWSNQFSPEQNAEMSREATAMLKEYGMSDQEIAWHWANNALFRSFPAQRLMADAARFRLAQQGAKHKVFHQIPNVQRPSSPLEAEPQQAVDMRRLNQRIDGLTGNAALKAAAELVARRRANRG